MHNFAHSCNYLLIDPPNDTIEITTFMLMKSYIMSLTVTNS